MGRRKTHEEFVAEVKALVGDEYMVMEQYTQSRVKLKIKHNKCGNIYRTMPQTLLNGSRCPSCSKKKQMRGIVKYVKQKKITHSDFVKRITESAGEEYVILDKFENTYTNVLLRHTVCNHEYQVLPKHFLRGSRCPKCNESKGERKISKWLSNNSIEFTTQEPIKYDKRKWPLKLDFFAQGVAIEYDGEYHYEVKPHAGGKKGLLHRQQLDAIKTQYCADNGIPLIRIPYWDFDNIDAILTEKLLPLLDASSTQKRAS